MLGEILENPLIFRTASALVEWQRNCHLSRNGGRDGT
jgi:hypothetical protein